MVVTVKIEEIKELMRKALALRGSRGICGIYDAPIIWNLSWRDTGPMVCQSF